jgi:hypothetical protein
VRKLPSADAAFLIGPHGQDYAAHDATDDGELQVAVLCDGSSAENMRGKKPRTDVGARNIALAVIMAILGGADRLGLIRKAIQNAIAAGMKFMGMKLADFATTVIFCALRRDEEAILHLHGDGCTAVHYRNHPVYGEAIEIRKYEFKIGGRSKAPYWCLWFKDKYTGYRNAADQKGYSGTEETVWYIVATGEAVRKPSRWISVRKATEGITRLFSATELQNIVALGAASDGSGEVTGKEFWQVVSTMMLWPDTGLQEQAEAAYQRSVLGDDLSFIRVLND